MTGGRVVNVWVRGLCRLSPLYRAYALPELRARLSLPVLISVSRKGFLGDLTGRRVGERGPATLAAELAAVARGADWICTHDVAALADALAVWGA